VNTTSGFPVGGNFILGQKMDDFTGIFEAEESFSGMITSFNVWDHLLNESSINSTVIFLLVLLDKEGPYKRTISPRRLLPLTGSSEPMVIP